MRCFFSFRQMFVIYRVTVKLRWELCDFKKGFILDIDWGNPSSNLAWNHNSFDNFFNAKWSCNVITKSFIYQGLYSTLRRNLNSIKAIDIWLSFCMVLVFAAVLEYAIANYLHRQSDGLLARNSQRFNQAKISSMCHDMLNRYESYHMRWIWSIQNGP